VVINHDPREVLQLRRFDRIAQLVVQRVEHVVWRETGDLPATSRGAGGHGSTGGHAASAAAPGPGG
jgi:dUTP pyrophosphatase